VPLNTVHIPRTQLLAHFPQIKLGLSSHQSVCVCVCVLSAYQEKIPARIAIYAHAQDFSAGDELLLAILKAFIPQPLNKQ
jgi:hypothetical protein